MTMTTPSWVRVRVRVRHRRRAVVLAFSACALTAAVTGAVAFMLAASDVPSPVAGLPDAGTLTRTALPALRALQDLAAMATVGALVTAVFLVPTRQRELGPGGLHLLRASSWSAAGWAVAALMSVPVTVSDLLGRPVTDVVTQGLLQQFALSTDQPLTLVLTAWLAAVVATGARSVRSRAAAAVLLVVAVAALLPPVFAGHSGHGESSLVAPVTVAAHVLTVAVWLGGLLALLALALRQDPDLARTASRFSPLALGCFMAVLVTGLVNVVSRLGLTAALWSTGYGLILVGKVSVLGLVGLIAWWHRRRTLPNVVAGRPRGFVALALAEVLLLTVSLALGAALSRTAPPDPDRPVPAALAQLA
jgi:putative copper export protein